MQKRTLNNENSSKIQYDSKALSSNNSLRLKSEFDNVRRNGKKYVSKYFLLIFTDSIDNKLKYGIICGRKFSKKAVTRNRVRRLIKESFRLINAQLKVNHIVFIPRKSMINSKMQDIHKEMINSCKKVGLWKQK
ncbi:MAG TPA: ribonuclease P protein component [Victivallales bacterium]|nr:ribonuclease P protein component [Victivallales bacterium]